jgi:phosphate-selective porin
MKKSLLVIGGFLLLQPINVHAATSLKDIQDTPVINVTKAEVDKAFDQNHWAYKRLENITKKYGLLMGKPGDAFDSKQPLSRGEAALLLVNLIGKIEKDSIKISDLEKDQLDILKEELTSEIQKMAGRVEELETSVNTLKGTVATIDNRVGKVEETASKAWLHPYGENFKLSGDLSFLYNGNFKRGSDQHLRNFDIDGSSLNVSGQLHKNIEYYAGLGFNKVFGGSNAADKMIDDAYIRTNIIPHHYIHLGQVRVPIGQEGSMSDIAADNIKKAMISRNFSDKRDVGVKAIGRWSWIDYYVGMFNGSGQNKQDNNNGFDMASWFMLKPLNKYPQYGNLELGYGYDVNKDYNDLYNTTWGTYAGYKYGKFKISSEYARKNGYKDTVLATDSHDRKAQGYYIRLAYDLNKKNQLLATYDVFDPSTGLSNNTIKEYTLGGSYALLENLKLRYNYVHIYNQAGRSSDRIGVLSTFCF